jgi:hypothetical protein
MPKPLPAILPAAPVSEALVEALADETGIPQHIVRGWLEGTRPLRGGHQRAALESLWSVLGGVSGRVLVRRVDRPAEGIVARAANNGERGGA